VANTFRILVVEDNPIFRQFLWEILQTQFPSDELFEAATGAEGLEKVDTLNPDLVFMDIQLPGENGLSLTRKIKAKHPGIIVVILTSYDSEEYRRAAFESGANHYVPKDSFLSLIKLISNGLHP